MDLVGAVLPGRRSRALARRTAVRRTGSLLARSFEDFSPDAARILRAEISAGLFITTFNVFTGPFTGLILRRDFHASPFQIACASSAGAVFMLFSLLWIRAMRRSAPLSFVVWPGLLARAGLLLTPFIHSAWPFAGVLIMAGLMNAVAGPAYSAVVQNVYPRDQRGRALALGRMIGSILTVALSPLAGLLLNLLSFRIVFPAAAVVGIAGALRQRGMRRGSSPEASQESVEWNRVIEMIRRDPSFRRLLLVSLLFGFGIWLQVPANPIMLVDVLHGTALQLGVAASVGGALGFFSNRYWGRLVDQRASVRVLSLVYLAGALTPLVYLIGFVLRTPWLILGTSGVDAIVSTGLDIVAMVAVMDVAGPERAVEYMGVYLTVAGVRGVIGPMLGAFVIQHGGLAGVYVVAAVVMLLASWAAARQTRGPMPSAIPPRVPRGSMG